MAEPQEQPVGQRGEWVESEPGRGGNARVTPMRSDWGALIVLPPPRLCRRPVPLKSLHRRPGFFRHRMLA